MPSNKIFYIRDYNYNIEACKDAAVSYMNDQLNKSNAIYGELQPYQENNVTVGYMIIFEWSFNRTINYNIRLSLNNNAKFKKNVANRSLNLA